MTSELSNILLVMKLELTHTSNKKEEYQLYVKINKKHLFICIYKYKWKGASCWSLYKTDYDIRSVQYQKIGQSSVCDRYNDFATFKQIRKVI